MQGILPLFSKKRDPRDKPEDDDIKEDPRDWPEDDVGKRRNR